MTNKPDVELTVGYCPTCDAERPVYWLHRKAFGAWECACSVCNPPEPEVKEEMDATE